MRYFLILIAIYIFVILYYRFRKDPEGINGTEKEYLVSSDQISFLYDLTNYNNGKLSSKQKILKAYIKAVQEAKNFILFDIFLFNSLKYEEERHKKVTDIIIDEMKKKKEVAKYFISDPLNSSYGTQNAESLVELEKTGTEVVITDIDKLRDNNHVYSGFWRMFFQWFGTKGKRTISHPMEKSKKTTIRALLKALNAKANHRKLLIADDKCIISSSNLHDSSSYYSNVGVEIRDSQVAKHFLEAEKAVAKMSGYQIDPPFIDYKNVNKNTHKLKVKPLMGEQIVRSIVDDLEKLEKDDKVYIGMLFIAHRKIINILKQKAKNGVKINIILDNNQVSFDQKKIGMPNIFVSPELEKAGINIYFFNDKRNEYHTKFVHIVKKHTAVLHLGSANLTRRSLLGTNLENNIRIEGKKDMKVYNETKEYIDKVMREPYSRKFKKRPSYYFLGNIWLRISEKLGMASW